MRWCTLEYGTLNNLYLRQDGCVEFTNFFEKVDNVIYMWRESTFSTYSESADYEIRNRVHEYNDWRDWIRARSNKKNTARRRQLVTRLHVRHGPGLYTTVMYIDESLVPRNEEHT